MIKCLCVALGGAVGAMLRYGMGLLPIPNKENFPFITLLINVMGAFLIGVVTGFSTRNKEMSEFLVLFLKVGICGGFTTFSTFSLESLNLLNSGRYMAAMVYIVVSVIFSVLACMIGMHLAQ